MLLAFNCWADVKPPIQLAVDICVGQKRLYELRQELITELDAADRHARIYTDGGPAVVHVRGVRAQIREQTARVDNARKIAKARHITPVSCDDRLLAEYVCEIEHETTCLTDNKYTGEMVNVGGGVTMPGGETYSYFWSDIYSDSDE